jgi:ABC-type phosphate transport system substrate-binding protein
MKSFVFFFTAFLLTLGFVQAQSNAHSQPNVHSQSGTPSKVVITGVRFAYPLLQEWIQQYKQVRPDVQIQIDPRTTTDPSQYDLLIEAYEPEASVKQSRDYVYIGRYALLPFANAQSAFAKEYGEKGLTGDLIRQVYFNNIYADKKAEKKIDIPYTVYTRVQKAGAPITFARYFGFEQANIKGKAIAGADEHLVKALLKDSTGISYTVPGLIYDRKTLRPLAGLTVLPVDADDNKRVSNDERFYGDLSAVLGKLEAGPVKNIPVEYIHLSIAKTSANAAALDFFKWVIENGQKSLHAHGFLLPEEKRFQQEKNQLQQQLGLK